MHIGRLRGEPWLWPAGPTAADAVEFNRDHPLAPSVVGYWVARGDVLQDVLATNGDMIAANSGSADSTPGGLAWGNVNATSVPGYIAHSTAWKPSSAVTVAALCGAARAGTNAAINTHLFGCEGTNNGWGVYFNGVGQTRAYCRVGAAWADQLAMVTWDQVPRLVGFTFDGSTFTARHDTASATQSISGSVTNSTVSLDLLGRGGLATTTGRAGMFQAFLVLDRALSAAEWADLATAPFQLLRTVRQVFGRSSSVATTATAIPGPGQIAITGHAPTASAGATAAIGAGQITVAGLAPTATAGATAAVGFGALAWQGHAPTVSAGAIASLGIATLSWQGWPVLAVGGSIAALPPAERRYSATLPSRAYAVTLPARAYTVTLPPRSYS